MARLILGQRSAGVKEEWTGLAQDGRLAGLLWFREACASGVEETASRIAASRALWPNGIDCIFAADEEGGLVQQLSGLITASGSVWPRLPSMRALGRGGDAGVAYAHGREIGRRMRIVGLDIALAPVVDLDPGPESGVIGTRSFSDDPELVATLSLAWLRGLSSTGVRGCIKHYPGHGATKIDTHIALPVIGDDINRARHRRPFEEIARRWRDTDGPPPAVMTAHIVVAPSGKPATFDSAALAELPQGLGPVWSDALEMEALDRFGDLETRAQMAEEAGVDLLILGEDVAGGVEAARRLAGRDSPGALESWPPAARPPVPDPWPFDEIVSAAAAGLRLLRQRPIPAGEWDWVLPADFGLYGPVAEPDPPGEGKRSIARLIRYRHDEPESLRAVLAESPERPALVGWLHRGLPDPESAAILAAAGSRVTGLAHLLDGPPGPVLPGVWAVETCGFGEGEMTALGKIWSLAPAERFAD